MWTSIKHFDGSDRPPTPPVREVMNGAFVEFLAMLFFVYFGCGAAASNAHFNNGEWDSASVTIIALQFGIGILVLVFATAHTSGGHINCAVTLALMIVGNCHPLRAIVYFAAQMTGSICGAALLKASTSGGLDRTGGLGSNGLQNKNVDVSDAFLVEMMGTALLVFVVLETAVNSRSCTTQRGGESIIRGEAQNLAPLSIGFAVFMAHVVCIPVTGCSINPTRSFGPALVSGTWDDHWIWWAGPCTGSVLATLVWLIMKKIEPNHGPPTKVVVVTSEPTRVKAYNEEENQTPNES
eukprot:Hpha_TRINITY_DN12748_c0_g1::TRINITY_DN12748_c0_g1_i1::g.114493::m.114493